MINDFFYTINIFYQSKDIVFSLLTDYWNNIEILPHELYTKTYIDVYNNLPKQEENIEPRYYWQFRLFNRALLNLNGWWAWPDYCPDVINYELKWPYLGDTEIKNINFSVNYFFIKNSIYENNLVPERLMTHHDYATKYIISHNYLLKNLSNNLNAGLSGFHFNYFEHFGSFEIIIQRWYVSLIDHILPSHFFDITFKHNNLSHLKNWEVSLLNHEDLLYFTRFKKIDFSYQDNDNWFEGFMIYK